MPSLRPRWSSSRRLSGEDDRRSATRPRPAVIASWIEGGLLLWGWDGEHTALPNALDRAIIGSAWPSTWSGIGHLTSFDLTLPDGRAIRPAARRMPGGRAAAALVDIDVRRATDSLAWFGALARAADETAAAGLVTPCVRTERELPVARWLVLDDAALGALLGELATSMPPICLPGPHDPTAVADIHGVFVDALARRRLAVTGWRPVLPSTRVPAVSAARVCSTRWRTTIR